MHLFALNVLYLYQWVHIRVRVRSRDEFLSFSPRYAVDCVYLHFSTQNFVKQQHKITFIIFVYKIYKFILYLSDE